MFDVQGFPLGAAVVSSCTVYRSRCRYFSNELFRHHSCLNHTTAVFPNMRAETWLLHEAPHPFLLFCPNTCLTGLWQMWGQLVPAILGEGRGCHHLHKQMCIGLNSFLNSLKLANVSIACALCTSRWILKMMLNLMFFDFCCSIVFILDLYNGSMFRHNCQTCNVPQSFISKHCKIIRFLLSLV